LQQQKPLFFAAILSPGDGSSFLAADEPGCVRWQGSLRFRIQFAKKRPKAKDDHWMSASRTGFFAAVPTGRCGETCSVL
jgi:hypothetical protein